MLLIIFCTHAEFAEHNSSEALALLERADADTIVRDDGEGKDINQITQWAADPFAKIAMLSPNAYVLPPGAYGINLQDALKGFFD